MRKVGIVGCGGIAQVHAWALSQQPNTEIAAVADCLPERAEALSEKYTEGKAKVYTSLQEMLAAERPDAVHICTPHYLHVPQAMEALQAGVAVFCEKPPAITREQLNDLKVLCRKADVPLGFCFQNRYNAAQLKTEEILQSGQLGKMIGARAIVTWRRDEGYYETDWKGKLSTEGGGALINQSIHSLDLLLRYLGEPERVEASLHNHHLQGSIEVEDTVEAWMEFAGGERACFYASTGYASDAPVLLEYTCEKGSILLVDKLVVVTGQDGTGETILVQEPVGIGKSYWGSGHLKCIADFYDKWDKGERFPNDLAGIETTMKVMFAIYDNR